MISYMLMFIRPITLSIEVSEISLTLQINVSLIYRSVHIPVI